MKLKLKKKPTSMTYSSSSTQSIHTLIAYQQMKRL